MRQDGKAFMDILAEETSPELWGFILDVFWTQFSGRCPAQQIRMLKGRIDVCHLKDISLNGREQRTAAVMEGKLVLDEIFGRLLGNRRQIRYGRAGRYLRQRPI